MGKKKVNLSEKKIPSHPAEEHALMAADHHRCSGNIVSSRPSAMVARKHLGNWNRDLQMLEQGSADVLVLDLHRYQSFRLLVDPITAPLKEELQQFFCCCLFS